MGGKASFNLKKSPSRPRPGGSPAPVPVDLCCHGCLSDAAMEGDKKRKRAASDSARPRSGGPLYIHNSESSRILAADAAPAGPPGPGIATKNTRQRGRPRVHHQPLTNNRAHLVNNRRNQRASSARSAAQVRHVVSVALDFTASLFSPPRLLPFRSLEPRIVLAPPTLQLAVPAPPPAPHRQSRYDKLIARMVPPGKLISALILPSARAAARRRSRPRQRCSCTQCQRSHPSPCACSN